MKTVLANVSNSFFVRNFLRSDAAKCLLDNGVTIILLCPKNKLEYYRKEFTDSLIVWDELPEIKKEGVERFFKFLETASIHTKTAYMLTKSQFRRTGSKRMAVLNYFDYFTRYIFWQLGRFYFWRALIRNMYSFFSNDSYDEILKKYNPGLIFLPSMIYSEDYILAKAAKKRGIKTIGMTLSWDNFYSKTLLMVEPDKLMVHTDEIVGQARKLGDYTGEIKVTGLPQYDIYFKKANLISRDEFFEKIGADKTKKLILYAFSGKAALNIEFQFLDLLHKVIKEGKIGNNIQVLLRPYPRYDFSKSKLEELENKYQFMIRAPVSHLQTGRGDWEFDNEAINFLANSLAHADLVITMYSTFFIESAIFDKPLIAIGFDGEKEFDYWNSARRFFDWEHLAQIGKTKGISIARNMNETTKYINDYFQKPSLHSEGRKRIVLEQCQFTDGKSGERLAKTILETI